MKIPPSMNMNKTLAATLLWLGLTPAAADAQNPVIRDQFTADPTARVFDGRIYLYPSHDIPSPVEKLKEWFCMADYHVFSSENLTDWQDHGVILKQDGVAWVDSTSYSMWAPDCVRKDGVYYFYFPAAPASGEKGFRVGVATASSPEGPFEPEPQPIDGIHGIDPCVLVDDDGEAYIYWSGMGMKGARLTPDMKRLASEPVAIEGLPEGFKEGPFVFRRDDKYYFTFPWVEHKTEALAYAMADNPLGPFEFKGIIMEPSPTGCWTNHHSITEYRGQWYLFYHHNDYSPGFDKNRSVRIDSLSFRPDGTIEKVVPTLRGVGETDARRAIELDRYSDISPVDAYIAFIDETRPFTGWKTVLSAPGAWVGYNGVDFGPTPPASVTARVLAPEGGVLDIYTRGPESAQPAASITVAPAGEWQEVKACVTADGSDAPSGLCDLTVRLRSGSDMSIDHICFDALPARSAQPCKNRK